MAAGSRYKLERNPHDRIAVTSRLAVLVEPRGFEPLTSAVRLRRSPN